MSLFTQIDVFCDSCPEWIEGSRTRRGAMWQAKQGGWGRCKIDDRARDLCPSCFTKLKEARAQLKEDKCLLA
jgi:hypothetical protein